MGGLDHHHANGRARDQPVAAWKIAGAGHVTDRHLGNGRPAGVQQLCQQLLMLGRINPVMTACEHGHGAAAKAGAMRGLIDAARQSGANNKTSLPEIAGDRAREFQSGT